MATATTITRVTGRWDDPGYGVRPGWFCEAFEGDRLSLDSQKIDWPCDVDEFGRDDTEGLEEALRDAFPGAEVEVED